MANLQIQANLNILLNNPQNLHQLSQINKMHSSSSMNLGN